MKNVMVSVGATESLFAAFQSLTFPGNEWIVFEPFYYYYLNMIAIAGGVPRFARLQSVRTSRNSLLSIACSECLTQQSWIFATPQE